MAKMQEPIENNPTSHSELIKKILAAFFYGISSFLIMVVNKTVLTHYQFPSFQVLGLGQMFATVLILGLCKMFGAVSFPEISSETFRQLLYTNKSTLK